MLTWSLGWAASPARLAITSLAFMFEEVPEPVWKTSTGNWSSCSPAATASPASAIADASPSSSSPSSPFARAAAALIWPSQWTTGAGTRSPDTGKFSTALVVSPPQSCSVICLLNRGRRKRASRRPRSRPPTCLVFAAVRDSSKILAGSVSRPKSSGRRQFVTGGGAEQVAELEARFGAALAARFGVEPRRRLDQRAADGRQVAALLVLRQAVGDRHHAVQLHLTRGVAEGAEEGAGPVEAGDRRRVAGRAAAGDGERSRDADERGGAGGREAAHRPHATADPPYLRCPYGHRLDGAPAGGLVAGADAAGADRGDAAGGRGGRLGRGRFAVGPRSWPRRDALEADREDLDPFRQLPLPHGGVFPGEVEVVAAAVARIAVVADPAEG